MIEASNAYAMMLCTAWFAPRVGNMPRKTMCSATQRSFEPVIGIPFPKVRKRCSAIARNTNTTPVGNILGLRHTGGSVERWIRWYQYALDSNRLLSTRLPGDAGKLPFYAAAPGYSGKYSHDAHGNMVQHAAPADDGVGLQGPAAATQRQVVNNGGTGEKTYYVYDGGGQRVRKITEDTERQAEGRAHLSGWL